MIGWIRRLLKDEQYIEWDEFTSTLDEMSVAEFRKRVSNENRKNMKAEN